MHLDEVKSMCILDDMVYIHQVHFQKNILFNCLHFILINNARYNHDTADNCYSALSFSLSIHTYVCVLLFLFTMLWRTKTEKKISL